MNRACLERPMGVSRAGVFIVTVAAALLANSATWTAALAQQRVPVAQPDEAPIGHVQPRIQDLPPSVAQDENKTLTELDDIAKKLEMIQKRICRGC